MEYRIFPAIGIARIGDSPEMFVGPEIIGSRGRESDGTEVTRFKDATFRVRKQAARFRVFQRANPGSAWVPLPDGKIKWTVSLANKKDAITRPPEPIDSELQDPNLAIRPQLDPSRTNRLIHASDSIPVGNSTAPRQLIGTHVGVPVKLGELRVDNDGHLLVLGGDIVSAANPATSPIGDDFYNNPGWHDDVADGPVMAEVTLPNSGGSIQADPAWVVIAPPDYAPGAEPIVTLFDEILEVAKTQNLGGPWIQLPATPSFTHDIFPIIRRARSLGWVHIDRNAQGTITNQKNWAQISQDYGELNKSGAGTQALRSTTRDQIMRVEQLLIVYKVTSHQQALLAQWVGGHFNSDWNGFPLPAVQPTAESLTRSALEGASGQGFFPGIEAGRIVVDPSIYSTPFDFRINSTVLGPGDVTALMAQPWQADFLKCARSWWPSQRPDLAPQPDGTFKDWKRPLNNNDHRKLVAMVRQFGMITVKYDGQGVQVAAAEQGRDTALPV